MPDPVRIRIATFNLRNTNDRYDERRPLLIEAFAAMDADIAALQEVVWDPAEQDDLLAQSLPKRPFRSLRAEAPEFPGAGTAILCGAGEVQVEQVISLGHRRTAQRALIILPGLHALWFVNTHLHHKHDEPEVREAQVAAIVDWMAAAPMADATVIAGDFNHPPSEAGYERMRAAGYRSAFVEVTGAEPPYTRPSGIIAPNMDSDRTPATFDYLWLGGSIRAEAACVAANRPAAHDPTLYPSDHYAVVADVVVGAPAASF